MSWLVRSVLVLCMFVLSGSLLQADDPPKKEVPKPLPKEIVAAWEKVGAKAGWSEVDKYGRSVFHPAETPPQAGWLPVFVIVYWKEGVLEELPAPDTAFELHLDSRKYNTYIRKEMDGGLKEL